MTDSPTNNQNGGYDILVETKSQGLIRRFFVTFWHSLGLIWGSLYLYVQQQKAAGHGWSLITIGLRLLLTLAWPFLNRALIKQPLPIQFRRRLEMLGPTYIKLGQILSLREDLLPKSITDELKNLLDRLPALPFPRYLELIQSNIALPIWDVFSEIDAIPLGVGLFGANTPGTPAFRGRSCLEVTKAQRPADCLK